MFSASQAFSRFYTFTFLCGYYQKIMSQQKRKARHPRIKQYFCSKPKQKFVAVSWPESANASSSACKGSFDSLVQDRQHSTVRISKSSSVSANSQYKHLTIGLFNHGLCWKVLMNPHKWMCYSACWTICLLCSKHPAVTTSWGKNSNIYTSEPARPPRPRPYRLDNHLSSD